MKKTLIFLIAFLLSGCAATISTLQIDVDKADRTAFTALQAFQTVEEVAWHTSSPTSWPSPAEHKRIGSELSTAYTLIQKIAAAALVLQPGQPLPTSISADLIKLSVQTTGILSNTEKAPTSVREKAIDARVQVAVFANHIIPKPQPKKKQ